MAKTITIPAPVSDNLALAMRVSGLVCLGTAAVSAFAVLSGLAVGGFWGVVYLPGMIGVGLLSMPGTLNNKRAKLLDQRADAAEKGELTCFIEKASDPDPVRMSLLFGLLAVVTFPILFGPAAVVTGIIALNQGHGRALFGVVMGVVGLAVWSVLVYYLVLR
jgi:hypothetical protein